MYYLADDDKNVVLCCKTPELATHLVLNGCRLITEEEFIIREEEYYVRMKPRFQLIDYRLAARKMLTELVRAA